MHYDPDGKVGRTMSGSDRQLHKDQVWALRFLVKLVFFPIWIITVVIRRRQRRRAMVEFARAFANTDGISARDIALKWAAEHHRHYPYAEYSSNFPKLEAGFQQIIHNSPQLTRRSVS